MTKLAEQSQENVYCIFREPFRFAKGRFGSCPQSAHDRHIGYPGIEQGLVASVHPVRAERHLFGPSVFRCPSTLHATGVHAAPR